MSLVTVANEPEAKDGEEDEEQVAQLVSLMPWMDLTWVCLVEQIVNSTVKPVTIAIDMEFIEVTELIEGVVLQVVNNDLILFCGLWLILETVLSHESVGLEGNELFWVHSWILAMIVSSRHHSTLLANQTFDPTLH